MTRTRLFAAAALLAAGAFAWSGVARAGDEVVKPAPAAEAAAPSSAPAPKTAETPETKTPSPIHSVLGWIGKQVAPGLDCPCPGTEAGEKAWRAWFAGGADVPLASLRDTLVADGWNADRMIAHFQAAKAKACAEGGCDKSKCADGACAGKCADGKCADGACAKKDGCCQGKGERADGKPCCGGCKDKPAEETAKPADAPAKP